MNRSLDMELLSQRLHTTVLLTVTPNLLLEIYQLIFSLPIHESLCQDQALVIPNICPSGEWKIASYYCHFFLCILKMTRSLSTCYMLIAHSNFLFCFCHLPFGQFFKCLVWEALCLQMFNNGNYRGCKCLPPVRTCNLYQRDILHFNEVRFGSLLFWVILDFIFLMKVYKYPVLHICKIRSCNMWQHGSTLRTLCSVKQASHRGTNPAWFNIGIWGV